MSRLRQVLKWALPFLVSSGLLSYQFSTIDTGGMLDHMTQRVAIIFIPALFIYGGFSLWIEALTLVRLLETTENLIALWTAARVKAASYLLYIINYSLGGGALMLLLRRRAGVGLSDGGGIVIMIALFDLGVLIILSGVSAALQDTDAPAVRAGLIAAMAIGLVGGFAMLRAPLPLGPLDRLRSRSLFRAARTIAPSKLLEVAMMRLIFITSFMAVGWSALWAFEIPVPLEYAVVNIAVVTLVATLPIAVAGLGTSQAAFLALFQNWGDEATLLACSLTLQIGLVLLRGAMGFVFSQEFVREAIRAVREGAEA
jgi:hypothetical protein